MVLFSRPRSQGPSSAWWPDCKIGTYFLAPATIFTGILWLLAFASTGYSVEVDKDPHAGTSGNDEKPIDWRNPNDCTGQSIIYLFLPVSLETAHLALHSALFLSRKLHPVTAAILSSCLFAFWVIMAAFGPLFDGCVERSMSGVWNGLFWSRHAVGDALAVLYLVYFVHACRAVGRWRGGWKKGEGVEESLKMEEK